MDIKEFNERNPRVHAFLTTRMENSPYRKVNCTHPMKCMWYRNSKLYVKHKYKNKNGDLRVFPKATSFCVSCLLQDDPNVQFASSEMRDIRELFESLKQERILS